jgi:hypothetical protein
MSALPASAFYARAPQYLAGLLVLAVLGFYRSYFARFFGADAVHHLHGLTATGWLVLLCTQAWLYRTRRLALHRALGRWSPLLVVLFLISGVLVLRRMLTAQDGFSQAFGMRLSFTDASSVVYFALAFGLALHYRHRLQIHARLMVSTALLVLPPALARAAGQYLPGIHSFEAAFHAGYVASELMVVGLIVHDLRHGGWRWPYPVLLAVMLVQQASFHAVPHWAWWQAWMQQLAATA